jgi:hypothetical protein
MFPEQIPAGARTVVGIATHFEELKASARRLLSSFEASRRGYFTPTEDLLHMALAGEHFQPLAVYCPQHASMLLTGPAAADVIHRTHRPQTV